MKFIQNYRFRAHTLHARETNPKYREYRGELAVEISEFDDMSAPVVAWWSPHAPLSIGRSTQVPLRVLDGHFYIPLMYEENEVKDLSDAVSMGLIRKATGRVDGKGDARVKSLKGQLLFATPSNIADLSRRNQVGRIAPYNYIDFDDKDESLSRTLIKSEIHSNRGNIEAVIKQNYDNIVSIGGAFFTKIDCPILELTSYSSNHAYTFRGDAKLENIRLITNEREIVKARKADGYYTASPAAEIVDRKMIEDHADLDVLLANELRKRITAQLNAVNTSYATKRVVASMLPMEAMLQFAHIRDFAITADTIEEFAELIKNYVTNDFISSYYLVDKDDMKWFVSTKGAKPEPGIEFPQK